MLSSKPNAGVRSGPQLATNQDFDAINMGLLAAGEAIETSRRNLFETRMLASSALHELEQERQNRQRCFDGYNKLNDQYRRRVEEVHEMTKKCVSLHKELEESQKMISNYESTGRDVAAEKVQLENRANDLERHTADLAQTIRVMLDREAWARRKIEELEEEITKGVARECLAVQKANELEKEKGHLSLALQRVDYIEKESERIIHEH